MPKTKVKTIFDTIADVIDSRQKHGAPDANIIAYLEHLKKVWKESRDVVNFCDMCIETIRDIPQVKGKI